MSRRCTCDRDGCTPCWLWHHSPLHRKGMGGDPREATKPGHPTRIGVKPEKKLQRKPPCVHLGPPTGATVECPTCSGSVRLKVFACEVYGACVLAAKPAGVRSCVGCGEYAPP